MIVDSISNSSQYYSVHKCFKEVFEYLKELPQNADTGSFVLETDNVWGSISVYLETGSKKVFEAHKNFIDIHYILSGEAKFGYCNIDRLRTTKSYDSKDDYELLEGESNVLHLKQGDFCIVFPQDGHIPVLEQIREDELVRAVVKVRLLAGE